MGIKYTGSDRSVPIKKREGVIKNKNKKGSKKINRNKEYCKFCQITETVFHEKHCHHLFVKHVYLTLHTKTREVLIYNQDQTRKKIERTFLINSYQRHASFCLGDWPKMFIHLSFEIIRIYHVNLLVWVPTVGRNIV